MTDSTLTKRIVGEALAQGSWFAGVVGSGIAVERLAGVNVAVRLLANTVAPGAAMVALILPSAPFRVHFDPAMAVLTLWNAVYLDAKLSAMLPRGLVAESQGLSPLT